MTQHLHSWVFLIREQKHLSSKPTKQYVVCPYDNIDLPYDSTGNIHPHTNVKTIVHSCTIHNKD